MTYTYISHTYDILTREASESLRRRREQTKTKMTYTYIILMTYTYVRQVSPFKEDRNTNRRNDIHICYTDDVHICEARELLQGRRKKIKKHV